MGRRLVLLGPPGAGKGTQATRLAALVGVPHIATGDMFRARMAAGDELGERVRAIYNKGELLPDELTIQLLLDRVTQPDASCGYLLDGFPRNRHQAEALDRVAGERRPQLALGFELPAEVAVRRISGRRSCARGHVFHVDFAPPQVDGVCDDCGSPLEQRSDDDEGVVRRRLAVYAEQAEALWDFYALDGRLRKLPAEGSLQQVFQRAVEALLP